MQTLVKFLVCDSFYCYTWINFRPHTQVQISLYFPISLKLTSALRAYSLEVAEISSQVVWGFLIFPSSFYPGEISFQSKSLKEKRNSALLPLLSPIYCVCWSFVVILPKVSSLWRPGIVLFIPFIFTFSCFPPEKIGIQWHRCLSKE